MAYSSKQRKQFNKQIAGILHLLHKDEASRKDYDNYVEEYFGEQYETAKKKYKTYIKGVAFENNLFNLIQYSILVGIGIALLYLMPPLVILPVAYFTYSIYENKPIKSLTFKTNKEVFHEFKTQQIYKHMLANDIAFLKHDHIIKTETLTYIDQNKLKLIQKKSKLKNARFRFSFLFISKESQIKGLQEKIKDQDMLTTKLKERIIDHKVRLIKFQNKILKVYSEIDKLNSNMEILFTKKELSFLLRKTESTFGDGIANETQKKFTNEVLEDAKKTIGRFKMQNFAKKMQEQKQKRESLLKKQQRALDIKLKDGELKNKRKARQ